MQADRWVVIFWWDDTKCVNKEHSHHTTTSVQIVPYKLKNKIVTQHILFIWYPHAERNETKSNTRLVEVERIYTSIMTIKLFDNFHPPCKLEVWHKILCVPCMVLLSSNITIHSETTKYTTESIMIITIVDKTHLGSCSHLRFTQRLCLYVNNSDILQTILLPTEIRRRANILISKRFIY